MMPDIFYSLTDFLITCLEIFLLLYLLKSEEKKKKYRWIVFAIIYIVATVLMTNMEVTLLVKFTVLVIIIVTLGQYVYKCSVFKLFVYGLSYVFSINISELIVMQSWNLFLDDPLTSDNIIFDEFLLSAIIAIKALHILLIIIIERIMGKDKLDRKFKEIIPIIMMGLPFFMVLESISLNLPYVTNEKNILIFIISSIAILVAYIYSIIFNNHYLSVRRKAQEEELTVYELQMKYDYYRKRMEDEDRVKEIYHDLKNHLLLADATIDYEVRKKLQRYENYYDLGNEFLNVIISEKSQLARENGIRFECDGDFKGFEFINPLDISTIFGNILDNSIEACLRVEACNRFIFLNIARKGDLLLIVIKNTMPDANDANKDFLKTNKRNKAFHGYGISNVKEAVKKYNGNVSISVENGDFIFSIVIPVPGEIGVLRHD